MEWGRDFERRRRLKSHARVRDRETGEYKGRGREGETRSHDQLNAKEGAHRIVKCCSALVPIDSRDVIRTRYS